MEDAQNTAVPTTATHDELSATWYKTSKYAFEIAPVQVLAVHSRTIKILNGDGKPERVNKVSDYRRYWATRDEAISHLRQRLDIIRSNAEQAEIDFRKLEAT